MQLGLRTILTTLTAFLLCAQYASAAETASSSHPSPLATVQPVIACSAIGGIDLQTAVGEKVTLKAARIETAKGTYCQVKGTIAPSIGFEVDLPEKKWTQRFLQAGCGGLCGNINASIGNATHCLPALDGEFVVAASDLGHQGAMMSPTEGDFGKNPQQLIDFAYRANHLTALASKALIRAYYGQPARYAYFSGCSDGGREALMEAQRYPTDFDGISAGAPAMLFTVQNSFWHAWTAAANHTPEGQPILYTDKLAVLHDAVIAHCDMIDGNKDGLLSDPRACHVEPSWVVCKESTADTDHCLTQAEWKAAEKIYQGPTDTNGYHFLPGGAQPGSELQWDFIPRRPNPQSGPAGPNFASSMLKNMSNVVYRNPTDSDSNADHFPFTTEQLSRVSQLHNLLDATNTDLSGFHAAGGKLLMWHGWSDTSIAPMISIAYYQALQQQLGTTTTDQFVRLFMLPGVGHCGGGDGFAQFDTLTSLMAWVEQGQAPTVITAEKIADRRMGPPPADKKMTPGSNGADGRGDGFANGRTPAPYAQAAAPTLATRPIYAYPFVATYQGSGNPLEATNYGPKQIPAISPLPAWPQSQLLSPGFQQVYEVREGQLTITMH